MSSFTLILTSKATASLSLQAEQIDSIYPKLVDQLGTKGITALIGLRRIHLRAKYGAHHESFESDIKSICENLLEA